MGGVTKNPEEQEMTIPPVETKQVAYPTLYKSTTKSIRKRCKTYFLFLIQHMRRRGTDASDLSTTDSKADVLILTLYTTFLVCFLFLCNLFETFLLGGRDD